MTPISILLVCQFGGPVRGLSPYGDALLESLQAEDGLAVQPIDYCAPYPGVLHPAARSGAPGAGELHWGRPASWRALAHMKGDIIHLQHWSAPMACYLAPLSRMARRSDKRIVVTVHNPDTHEALGWTRPFERRLLTRADALVVHDARGAQVLRERFGVAAERIHVIPHGIRTSPTPAMPEDDDYRRLGLARGRRYICIFGNLRGYKGIDILLAAWARVADRVPDTDLVIAGRLWSGQTGFGPRLVARMLGTDRDADRIRAALAAPELAGRVHLREGFQPDEDIDALLRVADLAVFPYVRFASQSGAACRAAGMGCPVLVSDVGGLPDLALDGRWIVVPGEVEALASKLCDRLASPDLQASRQEQLNHVRCHDWPNVASDHAVIYRRLAYRD